MRNLRVTHVHFRWHLTRSRRFVEVRTSVRTLSRDDARSLAEHFFRVQPVTHGGLYQSVVQHLENFWMCDRCGVSMKILNNHSTGNIRRYL